MEPTCQTVCPLTSPQQALIANGVRIRDKKLRPEVKLVIVEGATHGGDRCAFRQPEFIGAVRELLASTRSRSSRQ